MKKLLFIIGLVALAASARAQVPIYAAQALGMSNNVPLSYTNTQAPVMSLTKQDTTAVGITFSCNGTNAGVVTFIFTPSVDGVNYATSGTQTLNVTANGTNTVCINTNFLSYGSGYWKLSSVANTNAASSVTNLSVVYAVKISAP